MKDNPGVSTYKLFPIGQPGEGETLLNGTAYCKDHLPEAPTHPEKKEIWLKSLN